MINRTLIVLTWIVFAIVYTLTFQLAWDGTTADIPASKVLSAEQQDLHDTLLAEKKKNLPRLAIVQETGEVVYVSADGKWFSETPEWYKDKFVSLSDQEMSQVYSLAIVDAPAFVFWENKIYHSEYHTLIAMVTLGLACGLAAGLLVWFMLMGKVTPIVPIGGTAGIVFCLLIWLASGTAGVIVFGFAYIIPLVYVSWIASLTHKYWSAPPKNIGTANSA